MNTSVSTMIETTRQERNPFALTDFSILTVFSRCTTACLVS